MSTRVAVTGATGFVGRALVPALERRGCEVLVLGRADAAAGPDDVVDRVGRFAPSSVVHLATHFLSAHVPADIPALISANVVWGTVVAEAASACGARLVSVGSAWQHHDGQPYDPVSLYAATKQALAVIVDYYVRVRGLDATTVTLFDTYGPGDVRPKLVPLLMRAAREGRAVEMSDGGQLIDLTYIDDVVAGLCAVALDPSPVPDGVLRSGEPVTIRELVATLEDAIGRPVPTVWGVRESRPREMRSDWVFGQRLAGWGPSVTLPTGLRRTWDALDAEGQS